MTDPDSPAPHPSGTNSNLLEQIAATLGMTKEAFVLSHTPSAARLQILDELAELIRLFEQIDDKQPRQRCIAYVRAVADGADRTRIDREQGTAE